MEQGQFWLIKSEKELTERLGYMHNWLVEKWDWSKPLCIKAAVYSEERSISQNALLHKWFREMAVHFEKRSPVDEEQMKMLLKHKFLGTTDIIIGSTTIAGQVKSTRRMDKGDMHFFMDQIYDWAADHGVKLSNPENSEYMRLTKEQVK